MTYQNLIDFNEYLFKYDWSIILQNSDIDFAFDGFIKIIQLGKEKYASTRKIYNDECAKP